MNKIGVFSQDWLVCACVCTIMDPAQFIRNITHIHWLDFAYSSKISGTHMCASMSGFSSSSTFLKFCHCFCPHFQVGPQAWVELSCCLVSAPYIWAYILLTKIIVFFPYIAIKSQFLPLIIAWCLVEELFGCLLLYLLHTLSSSDLLSFWPGCSTPHITVWL